MKGPKRGESALASPKTCVNITLLFPVFQTRMMLPLLVFLIQGLCQDNTIADTFLPIYLASGHVVFSLAARARGFSGQTSSNTNPTLARRPCF